MPPDIAATRRWADRGGISLNAEQQLRDDLGVFLRAGWAEGDKETYEFTDIDRTVAAGLALTRGPLGPRGLRYGGLPRAWPTRRRSNAKQPSWRAGGFLGSLIGDGKLINSRT